MARPGRLVCSFRHGPLHGRMMEVAPETKDWHTHTVHVAPPLTPFSALASEEPLPVGRPLRITYRAVRRLPGPIDTCRVLMMPEQMLTADWELPDPSLN